MGPQTIGIQRPAARFSSLSGLKGKPWRHDPPSQIWSTTLCQTLPSYQAYECPGSREGAPLVLRRVWPHKHCVSLLATALCRERLWWASCRPHEHKRNTLPLTTIIAGCLGELALALCSVVSSCRLRCHLV